MSFQKNEIESEFSGNLYVSWLIENEFTKQKITSTHNFCTNPFKH